MTIEQYLVNSISKDEIIYDWKGNEVKEGDEICIVQIKERHYKSVLMMPNGENIVFNIPEEKEIWEVGKSQLVFKHNGKLAIEQSSENFNLTLYLNTFLIFINEGYHLWAIKGLSDSKY